MYENVVIIAPYSTFKDLARKALKNLEIDIYTGDLGQGLDLARELIENYKGLVGSLTGVSAISFFTQSFIDKYGCDTLEEVVENKALIRIGCSPKGSMDEHVVNMALNLFY